MDKQNETLIDRLSHSSKVEQLSDWAPTLSLSATHKVEFELGDEEFGHVRERREGSCKSLSYLA